MKNKRTNFLFICTLLLFFVLAPTNAFSGTEKAFQVKMRDGITLSTIVLRPFVKGKYPALLIRSPYKLGSIVKNLKQGIDLFKIIIVAQNSRGRYASKGEDTIFGDAKNDGADTVEWIKKQAWFNGTLSTYGPSALGITQYLMAESATGINAQFVMVATPDLYTHAMMPGGVLRQALALNWSNKQARSNGKPTPHPMIKKFEKNRLSNSAFWKKRRVNDWSKVSAETVHMGGWYDVFSQGTLDAFTAYSKKADPQYRQKQKLIMGPWTHGTTFKSKQGELSYPSNAQSANGMNLLNFTIQWINNYLTGSSKSIKNRPAVSYYLMGDTTDPNAPGNEWKSAKEWPVPNTQTPYYLHENGKLSKQKPNAGKSLSNYKFDPKNPVPSLGGNNLTIKAGPLDQKILESRSDVLVFSTETLKQPVKVVGKITAKLWVSTNAKDTDFTAKLTDVYPDGKSMLVLDGIIRLRHRKSTEREDFVTPGQVVEVTIDLWSTALVFNKGHKIRLTISSSNFPRFQVNPNTGEAITLKPTKFYTALNTLYHEQAKPSHLILPILPLDKPKPQEEPEIEKPQEQNKVDAPIQKEAIPEDAGITQDKDNPKDDGVVVDKGNGKLADAEPNESKSSSDGFESPDTVNPSAPKGCGCSQTTREPAFPITMLFGFLILYVLRLRSRRRVL